MADTVNELLVKLRPEGTAETQQELEGTADSFEDAAETAGEQSGQLEEFAQRWQGAMGVFVAGLSIAAAGLLSKVPVIGEAASGLGAIIDSIAFKMDSVLRPVLGPISNLFFGVADTIDSMEGPFGVLVGVVGTVVAVLGVLAGALGAVGGVLGGISGAVSAVVGGFSFLAGAVTTVATVVGGALAAIAGAISLPIAAIAALIAAVVGFVAAYITNWNGVRDKTNAVIGKIIGFLKNLVVRGIKFLNGLVDGAAAFVGNFIGTLLKLGARITAWLDKLKATFITGFQLIFDLAVNAVKRGANGIISNIEGLVNRAISALNKLPGVNLGQVSLGRFEVSSRQKIVQTANRRLTTRFQEADARRTRRSQEIDRQMERLISAMQSADIEVPLNLDGKEVERATTGLMEDRIASRGRGTPQG